MIVEGPFDRHAGWVGGIKKPQDFNEFATMMAVLHQGIERYTPGSGLWGKKAQLQRPASLGSRVFRIPRGVVREYIIRQEQDTPGLAEHVALTGPFGWSISTKIASAIPPTALTRARICRRVFTYQHRG